MRNLLIMLFLLWFVNPAFGSSILWDYYSLHKDSYLPEYGRTYYFTTPSSSISPCSGIILISEYTMVSFLNVDRDGLSVSAKGYNGVEYESSWVVANAGDVCNGTYIEQEGQLHGYFCKSSMDEMEENFGGGYSVTLLDGDSIYMAFSARDFEAPDFSAYGWVLFTNKAGELQIVHSAFDIDGDPIVVGQMPEPEPAAGTLAALGLAALLLRRKFSEIRA